MWKPDPSIIVTAELKAAEAREHLRKRMTDAIQAHLDTTARTRNYDSIQSAITYRGDPNPQFAAEGQALFEWRSAVWTYATEQLAAVEAGDREAPETAEAFIAELPPFEWPVLEPSEA